MLRVTGSVGRLGLVLAAQATLGLLLTLAGGLAGDRFPRKRVLTASVGARLTVATVLAATLLAGCASFGLLVAMAAVYGCADGFFGPASVAVLPEVVAQRSAGSGECAGWRVDVGAADRGASFGWGYRGRVRTRRCVRGPGFDPGGGVPGAGPAASRSWAGTARSDRSAGPVAGRVERVRAGSLALVADRRMGSFLPDSSFAFGSSGTGDRTEELRRCGRRGG